MPPRSLDPSLLTAPTPWLVAVLHLPALPGCPQARLPVEAIAENAAQDARLAQEAGFTAVLLENYHDTPFRPQRVDPETVAAMALVGRAVRAAVELPLGFNVLRNDALAALALAAVTGGSFVRVNVLAGAAVTDQGLLQGEADVLLRRRAALGAGHVAILADVDVKHATSLDRRPLAERARDLVTRDGADAVLVTGPSTGAPVDGDELAAVVAAAAPAPVLAASGCTPDNLGPLLRRCSGAIVGTAIKDPATGRLDRTRAHALVRSALSEARQA